MNLARSWGHKSIYKDTNFISTHNEQLGNKVRKRIELTKASTNTIIRNKLNEKMYKIYTLKTKEEC